MCLRFHVPAAEDPFLGVWSHTAEQVHDPLDRDVTAQLDARNADYNGISTAIA